MLTGGCAVVAGLAWSAAAVLHSRQPEGCVGGVCEIAGQMRGATPATEVLFLLAGATLVLSLGGLLLLARRGGRLGRTGWAAGIACALGLGLFLAAAAVSTFGDPDWSGMPVLVGPGLGLLVVGLVLAAVIVWRARVLPRAVTVVVLLTALLLPLANEQTSRVLMAVPFGLAWAVVGGALLLRESRGAITELADAPV